MIQKRILIPSRLRTLPRQNWSWIDRRFTRELILPLSRDAICLYFFLAAVSDKHGLSFYSDPVVAMRLQMDQTAIAPARDQLIAHDLVAYQAPLTQVLSLPAPPPRQDGIHSLGGILRGLVER